MNSNKYAIGTFIALCITLTTGFLIGSMFGDQWLLQAESNVIKGLLKDFEQLHVVQQQTEEKVEFLHKLNAGYMQRHQPQFSLAEISYTVLRQPEDVKYICWALELYGASPDPPTAKTAMVNHAYADMQSEADIVISTPASRFFIELGNLKGQEPAEMVEFIHFIKQLTEEQEANEWRVYHYTGLQ